MHVSDRQAAAALTRDIAWKVACGLALDARGFDASVLAYWRRRLNASDRPHHIDEAVKDVVAATGVLNRKTRRALDSTVLDDAVATQDTVTHLVAAIRKVRGLVPAARDVAVSAHDYDRGGKPDCAWDDQVARDALVSALVADAVAIIDFLPVVGLDEAQERAVALLALIAGQDVEPGEQPGTWRIARAVAQDRVVSTVDPESRHAHKSRASYRDGYKAHVAVEPETGLITANTLTAGNTADGAVATVLLDGETRRSLVERLIAWLVKDGHRRCRYRGIKRHQLGFSLRVAAVNLTRLCNLDTHYDSGWKIPWPLKIHGLAPKRVHSTRSLLSTAKSRPTTPPNSPVAP